MTAAQPPGSDPAPGTGNGAEPGQVASGDASATGSEGSEDGGSEGSRKDYLARIRGEPEFAAEEVRKWQREADSTGAKYRELDGWLGKLGELRSNPAFTGDAIRQHLEDYNRVLSDPKLRPVIEGYLRTGQAPGSSAPDDRSDEDDEFLTEEQREIRTLKQQIGELRGEIGQVDHSTAVGRLQSHFERVAGDLQLTGKDSEKVFESVRSVIDNWAKQGDAGRRALRLLQGPNGQKEVRRLMVQQIDELGLSDQLALARLRAKGEQLGSLATDGPGQVASRGDEPMPEHKTTLEALRAARAHPELTEKMYG